MRYHRHLLCCGALAALFALSTAPVQAQVGGASGASGGGSTSSGSGSSSGSGTSVSGGFTGGGNSSSGGFTGSSGTGSSNSGGFTGNTTSPSGKTGSGSGTSVPSQSNSFLSTYANPLTQGLLDITGKPTSNKAFGQPSYPLYSGSGTTTGGAGGGFGGFQ